MTDDQFVAAFEGCTIRDETLKSVEPNIQWNAFHGQNIIHDIQ